ncbi:MAG TPA: PLD nuclease N-terminal domain-containing protein [Tepidisphaeraceae bacterium]|jgi:hypothetical protein|nr:PLD nuclease N-terminal domain-containing protein [Tepidisphaeraceae bacterium]
MGMYGLVATLILVLDIYVIYLVLIGGADIGMKLLWIILVLMLPFVGPLLYFLLGPGKRLA